jgi:hypothetical protein
MQLGHYFFINFDVRRYTTFHSDTILLVAIIISNHVYGMGIKFCSCKTPEIDEDISCLSSNSNSNDNPSILEILGKEVSYGDGFLHIGDFKINLKFEIIY